MIICATIIRYNLVCRDKARRRHNTRYGNEDSPSRTFLPVFDKSGF